VRVKSPEHWMALFSCAGRGAREIGWREWEGCPQGVHRKCRKGGVKIRCPFL